MDIAWNPFDDNEIASCSEDCTIKIWTIPDEGLNDTLVDCKKELVGHSRKCGHILWHPCATNILASNGFDNKIIIWNTVSGEQLFVLDGFHEDTIYSMCWSYDGSVIATTCKDKKLRLFDVRAKELLAVSVNTQLFSCVCCINLISLHSHALCYLLPVYLLTSSFSDPFPFLIPFYILPPPSLTLTYPSIPPSSSPSPPFLPHPSFLLSSPGGGVSPRG